MALSIKDGGAWRAISAYHIKDGGTWKRAQRLFMKQDGVWYQVLQAEIPKNAVSTTSVPSATSYFSDAELDNPLLVKRLTVPVGVDIAAPAGSTHAMTIRHRGWKGDLIIDVLGAISGRGGTIALGVGGNALLVNGRGTDNQRAIVNNYGAMRAGGGPGGYGGQGGAGYYQTPYTYQEGPEFYLYDPSKSHYHDQGGGLHWRGTYLGSWYYHPEGVIITTGGWTYGRTATSGYNEYGGSEGDTLVASYFYVYRYQTRYNTYYTTGGAGGAPGRGQGSDGAAAAGAAGNGPSGSGAGTGGTGGTGGGWGAQGNTGNTGGAGNNGGGLAGTAGGLAGYYITGIADIVFTNAGTVQGRVN